MIWGESLNLLHRKRYFILQDTNHFVIINSQSVNISSLIHKVASCRFSGKVYYMADSAAARCSEFCALIGPSCSLGISRVGPLRESSLFGRMMNRGYYMAARSANEWNIFQHEKRNFVSPSGHVMISLLCKHQWNAKPFHLNIFFCCERRDLLWGHSNGDLFTCENNVWGFHVFTRKPTWYFIGVYI